MRSTSLTTCLIVSGALLVGATRAGAQDWPQWRGPNRDARATGFTAPKTWPKELTQKWQATVGTGDATPALVGDKLYVFSRQGGDEVTRCLDAASGKEVWQDKYPSEPSTGASGSHPGPRSSPAVADGKVVTLGVRGILSCLDAATGKVVWRKDDVKGWPQFYTSSSPIIVNGLCIAQLGGGNGAIVAYDLATGNEKWKRTDSTAYASPVLLTVGGTRAIVTETGQDIVAVAVADGKELWKTAFAPAGRMGYNADTPIVDGSTIIISGAGRGTRAVKVEKQGDGLSAKDLWTNKDIAVQFNTPVAKNGLVYGITAQNQLFCLSEETGKTAWTARIGGSRGFGSVVDAGPVLMALTNGGELVVFEPTDKAFKELAKYKVGNEPYAYPVVSGNRVFIKDKDKVTLFTID